jgi:hypothetical protein
MKLISKTGLRNLLAVGGFFVLSTAYVVHEGISYPTGAAGTTNHPKQTPGCSCHSSEESSETVVNISTEATTFEAGKTYRFKVTVTNPSEAKAGVTVAKWLGGRGDTTSGLNVVSGQGMSKSGAFQLVHSTPKTLVNGTATWEFDYVAPPANKPFDTLYATGNAVNGDGDALGEGGVETDFWGLAPKFIVRLGTNAVSPRNDVAEAFAIGPNPARNSAKLFFMMKKPADLRISLVDAAGREVFVQHKNDLSFGRGEVMLDLANLSAGDYLVNVTSSGSLLYTGKLSHSK